MAPLKHKLQYYAYKYPATYNWVRILTCPFACCIVCPLSCWLTPVIVCEGCVKGSAKHRRREKMSQVHFEHKSRKVNRRNSLSVGQPSGFWSGMLRKKTCNQLNSPLYSKLPPELRAAVFELVLSDNFYLKESRKYSRFKEVIATVGGGPDGPRDEYPRTTLLRTCRLVYSEALPLLYSASQFSFSQTTILANFLSIIPTAHFQHIRFLKFHRIIKESFDVDQVTFMMQQHSPPIVQSLERLGALHVVFFIYSHAQNTYLHDQGTRDMLRSKMPAWLDDMKRWVPAHCKILLCVHEGSTISSISNVERPYDVDFSVLQNYEGPHTELCKRA